MISKSSSGRSRPGFTLIELLVVIAILIVLVGLTTSAVMRFRVTGPRLATKTNLQNIKKQLDSQWSAVLGKADKESIPTAMQAGLVIATGASGVSDPRVHSAYNQLKLVQAFPVSFGEVMNPPATFLTPWPAYVRHLASLGVTPANANTIATLDIQQSICLLMILEKGPNNSGITQESLGSTNTKLLTVGTKTAYGCVDAFGTPLLFSRGAGPVLAPLIVSAGVDMQYGVDITNPAFPVTSPNFATDNLTAP